MEPVKVLTDTDQALYFSSASVFFLILFHPFPIFISIILLKPSDPFDVMWVMVPALTSCRDKRNQPPTRLGVGQDGLLMCLWTFLTLPVIT